MKVLISLSLALFILCFSSCKKKSGTQEQVFQGSIDITSIHDNDTIHGGTTFPVQGTATGNTEMHGYDLQILDGQGNFIQDSPSSEHSTHYSFSHDFTHSYTDTMNLQLNVVVVTDHDGTTMTKSIPFVFVP